MLTRDKIEEYIKAHALAWAPTSLKTERSRLESLLQLPYTQVMDDAESLYKELTKKYKPYTVKTIFIRLGDYCAHFNLKNPYREFLKSHRNLFKSAYTRESLHVDYAEALSRISRIKCPKVRDTAKAMLTSGLRSCEIGRTDGITIVGKGNKIRPFLGENIPINIPKNTLWLALKKVGLKPHTLRKLFATRLLERGMDLHNVCQVMGWSNYNTAQYYLQPKKDDELRAFIKKAVA